MSRCSIPNVIFSGIERRREAIQEARERGLDGAARPGDDLLMPGGLSASDTYIGEMVDAFEEGRRERKKGGRS